MTILQLISSEGYYGAESMLLALARALAATGCRAIVGVLRDSHSHPSELETRAAQLGLEVVMVNCEGRWDWAAVRQLRAFVEHRGVEVLHTHGYKADVYGYAAAWSNRVALVATCHNWPNRQLGMRTYAAIDRVTLRHFDRVATASGPVAEILRRWKVPASKLRTIPNGVDMEPFRQPARSLRDDFTAASGRLVGFVGRLVPDKGGATLLAAAPAVLAEFPDVKFVFAGEGPARSEWESLAARLGILSSVVFAGQRNDMPSLYASLDMVVLPSFAEAMPMCLLEALAAAKPVVASCVGAVPEVVIPGVTGLLVEPGDPNALSAAMLRLLRDSALARMLGTHGRAHVARRFSSTVVASSYLGLYQEALRDHIRQTDIHPAWQRSRL